MISSVLSVALVAPNAVQVFGKLFGYGKKNVNVNSIVKARGRLIDQGLLESKNGFLSLTTQGQCVLHKLRILDVKLKKPRRWDGKWRVVIFDIPESRRHIRDLFRRTLLATGFVKLQGSVWIYPYPCEDFIA